VKAKTKKVLKHQKILQFKKIKNLIRLVVVPHKKNQYRPHLTRRYGLVIVLVLVFGLQIGYNFIKTGQVLGIESNITITSLYERTNQERSKVGVKTLTLSEKLNQAAYLKAQDMFDKQYWAHDSPDGTEPWKWFGDVGYNYNKAGENLAKNFNTTNGVMTAWLNSIEHKKNVLNPDYEDVGFAVVSGDMNGETISLVVALYGMPAEKAVAGVSNNFVESPVNQGSNITTQFAVAIQSLTPAVMVGLSLIAFAIIVASSAHANRHKLPRALRKSWYRHHGLYKAVGLTFIGLAIILLYSNGQI